MKLREMADGRCGELYMFSPEKIEIEADYNVRNNFGQDDDFKELKCSIAANGIQTPLAVRKNGDQIVLVRGHRRLEAVKQLIAEGSEIKRVPAFAVNYTDEERVLDLITSNSGKQLNMLEMGRVYKKLQNFGWTLEQMALKSGKSMTHVHNSLKVVSTPSEVCKLVEMNKITASKCLEIANQGKDKTEEEIVSAAKAAAEERQKNTTSGKTQPRKKSLKISQDVYDQIVDIFSENEIEIPSDEVDVIFEILKKYVK